jgi:hypothetical protein
MTEDKPLVSEEILADLRVAATAPKPQTLAELWALPLVPLDVFLEMVGVPLSSYYTLRAKGETFPVTKFGRKIFVRPNEVAGWFASRPAETGAA